jgi:Putative prokaryotic signal transducing protein
VTDAWSEVVTYTDRISAEAALGLLVENGLPGRITSDEHIPGLGGYYSVVVPAALLPQARSLLEEAQVSEKELTRLAMEGPPP